MQNTVKVSKMTETTLEKKTAWSPKWQTLFDTEREMEELEPLIQDLEKQGVKRQEWGMWRLIDETRDTWSVMYDAERHTYMIALSYDPDIGVFQFYETDKQGVTREKITDKDHAVQRFKGALESIYGGK